MSNEHPTIDPASDLLQLTENAEAFFQEQDAARQAAQERLDTLGEAVAEQQAAQQAAQDARRQAALADQDAQVVALTADMEARRQWLDDRRAELEALHEELARLDSERDAGLEQLLAELAAERQELEWQSETDVEREREDAFSKVNAELDDARTPLTEAGRLVDQRLTTIRRYLYSKLPLPWIGYSGPCIITAVNTTTKLATVRLQDGSQGTVDGVEYGSSSPVVGNPTTLYQAVQAPSDPRDPRVRPVPAGRCWITVPPGGKFAYYEYAGKLWKTPWPLTDPDAEPELVRDLLGTVSFGGEHGWHPEQNLGFDGLGTWWVEVNWSEVGPGYLTDQFRLVGWDALGTGAVHEHNYGSMSGIGGPGAVGLKPRVWAVDPTPGYAGLMSVQSVRGGGSAPAYAVSIGICFADAPDGALTCGPLFLADDRHGFSGTQSEGGQEYRTPIVEHNAYWLWRDEAGRAARWGIQPRRALHEDFARFYDEHSADAELSNAGYWSIWWAGPGDEPGQVRVFVVRENGVEVTRRDPDGSLHPVTWPDGFDPGLPRFPLPAGQDRTLTDLLVVDASRVYWASEDGGETWYRCPFQLPFRITFEGGKWVYIVDETEYAAA